MSSSISTVSRSRIEELPAETLGHVLKYINIFTGSDGIRNEKDVRVAMKYVGNLALTSKRMYALVNDLIAARTFIESLSHKYGSSPEYFAALWDTPGARRWLWQRVGENGDKESYQIIQSVYEVASQVKKEAQEAGLPFDLAEGRIGWPSPMSTQNQTESGFELYVGNGISHLLTPFGEIKIFGGGITKYYSNFSVAEVMIRRLGATFQGLSPEREMERIYSYEVDPVSDRADTIRKITDVDEIRSHVPFQDVERIKGTRTLVINSCNWSVYHMSCVAGRPIPPPTWHASTEDQRKWTLIQKIWDMLEMERLGEDPTLKKVDVEEVALKRSRKEAEVAKIQNLPEMAQYAANVMRRLFEQPVLMYPDCLLASQRLMMDDFYEAKVIEQLSDESQGERKTHFIRGFMGKEKGLTNGYFLERTVVSTIPPPPIMDNLEQTYLEILLRISAGWQKADLKNYPHILAKESEEEWDLFIKLVPMHMEALFLSCLASPLGISKSIHCNDTWSMGDPFGAAKPLYLWIRKSEQKRVKNILSLPT